MKFVSHLQSGVEKAAVLHDGQLYNVAELNSNIPSTMLALLQDWDANLAVIKSAMASVASGDLKVNTLSFNDAQLLAPVPRPTSCRDGYAFRQHVAAARRNRGVEMIAEFDQYPIFYFTNHNAIQGPGPIECMPDHFEKLDFELEVAVIVGKKGRNIPAADADNYIAGYCIMNDMSARTLQMEEMLLNLGPAKGKDFSTVIGPWMITPDELEPFKIPAKPNHVGNNYNLKMTCKVNGIQVSEGNMGDMDWTFAEILERCAYGVDILPGDVIGSGTVGTGCFLELNGTAKLNNPDAVPQWLKANDEVVLEVEQMGTLTNTIKAVDTEFSILNLKKK
jgi:fumarylacetoacetate (FAA) hydrolase